MTERPSRKTKRKRRRTNPHTAHIEFLRQYAKQALTFSEAAALLHDISSYGHGHWRTASAAETLALDYWPKSRRELLWALHHCHDSQIVRWLLEFFAMTGDVSLLPVLRRAATSEDWRRRNAVAKRLLQGMPKDKALAVLASLSRDPEGPVRSTVYHALGAALKATENEGELRKFVYSLPRAAFAEVNEWLEKRPPGAFDSSNMSPAYEALRDVWLEKLASDRQRSLARLSQTTSQKQTGPRTRL